MSVRMLVWGTSQGSAVTIVGHNDRIVWCGAGCGSPGDGDHFSPYARFSGLPGAGSLDTLVVSSLREDRIGDLVNIHVSRVRRLIWNPAALRFGPSVGTSPALKRLASISHSASTPPVLGWPMPFGRATARLFVYCFGVTKNIGTNVRDYSVVTFLRYGTTILCIPGDIEATGWTELASRPSFQRLLNGCQVLVLSQLSSLKSFDAPLETAFPQVRLLLTSTDTRQVGPLDAADCPLDRKGATVPQEQTGGGFLPPIKGARIYDLEPDGLKALADTSNSATGEC